MEEPNESVHTLRNTHSKKKKKLNFKVGWILLENKHTHV